MIRYLYVGVCVLLAVAGISMAAVRWMQSYVGEPAPTMSEARPLPGGLPVVDPNELPVLYQVEDFDFTDQNGEPFTSDTVSGKVWVAYLFFTACPGQCPIMTSNMHPISEAFLEEEQVYFAGISVDPETDNTERLAQYAAQYKVNNPRWRMVNGPIEAVEKLAVESFRLGSVEDPQMHSEKFVLIDQLGNIRKYYNGTDEAEGAVLMEDIRRLLAEEAATAEQGS